MRQLRYIVLFLCCVSAAFAGGFVDGQSTDSGTPFSGIAGYATNAGTAAFSTNSSYATNSGAAAYATNAGSSAYATNAGTAAFATNASQLNAKNEAGLSVATAQVAIVANDVGSAVSNAFDGKYFNKLTGGTIQGDTSISGNLYIAKTMYVTNVYETNMYVTFTQMVVKGSVTVAEGDIVASNNVNVYGTQTAARYYGDGSALTGITATQVGAATNAGSAGGPIMGQSNGLWVALPSVAAADLTQWANNPAVSNVILGTNILSSSGTGGIWISSIGQVTIGQETNIHSSMFDTNGIATFTRSLKRLQLNPNFGAGNTYASIATPTGDGMDLRTVVNGLNSVSMTTNSKVGIMTIAPNKTLEVTGDIGLTSASNFLFASKINGVGGTAGITISSTGLVGINSTNVRSRLTVVRDQKGGASEPQYLGDIHLEATAGNVNEAGGIEFHSSDSGEGYGARITCPSTLGKVGLHIQTRHGSTNWSEVMFMPSDTRFVMIGSTNTPNKQVEITGDLRMTAATNQIWFGPNYYEYYDTVTGGKVGVTVP